MNHLDVIKSFRNGKNRKSGNVFADNNGINDVLYSYGRNFWLAVKRVNKDGSEWFLLNGDKYSNSTNKHQSQTFQVFSDQPRVSFSALRSAGIDYNTCKLVDFTKDCAQTVNIKWSDADSFYNFENTVPVGATFGVKRNENQDITEKWFHRIGGVVLEQNGRYYLCAMDESQYFISELPVKVKSVGEAFECLKPEAVKEFEREYNEKVLRQGEWFFVPTFFSTQKSLFQKGFNLPYRDGGNRHIATRGYFASIGILVKGIVRHKRPDGSRGTHRQLKLDDGIVYVAYRNTEINSWSASGNVD